MRASLLALVLVLIGCDAPAPVAVESLTLTPCHVRGVNNETRCGVLSRPEDPSKPDGRQIPLRVVMLPAVSPTPAADPLFLLAGGPGQASTEIIAMIAPALRRIHSRRDLIFVDQRGTGASNALDCPEDEEDPLTALSGPSEQEEIVDCLRGVQDHADLNFYGTSLAADDLDAVAEALGYAQVNVFGGSYGTRLGLEWARRHPSRVRTLILDGVAPPQEPILGGSAGDAAAAFEALVRDCEADPSCAALNPKDDLLALLTELQTPRPAQLDHPRTGEPLSVEIDADHLLGLLRGMLYAPELARLMPLALDDARSGELGPFLAQASMATGGAAAGMSLGLTLTVICAEDAPRLTPPNAPPVSVERIGATAPQSFLEMCAVWPRAEVDPAFFEPVSVTTPTLLLSGVLDPVTPPRLAELAKETLPNAVHGVAPGAGHGVITQGCGPKLARLLIESGTTEGLDLTCLDTVARPAFHTSRLGAAPPEAPDAAR
ncbi:MAG: alpha/beta hydrolase [Deltaproteobacteria bacterium]|nr:alpha/beta hydrolase [Deltaproteobacteria bacterium]